MALDQTPKCQFEAQADGDLMGADLTLYFTSRSLSSTLMLSTSFYSFVFNSMCESLLFCLIDVSQIICAFFADNHRLKSHDTVHV